MKYMRIGIGLEKEPDNSTALKLSMKFESTKPASSKVRTIVASSLVIIAFAVSIWALSATDVQDTKPTTNLSGVLSWR